MPRLPDPADLEALKAFDTPTICNALELVAPARRAIGFRRRPLFAAFPGLKPIVAFARTAIIRSREPHPRGREDAKEVRLGYYAHIAAEPLPSIAVIQDDVVRRYDHTGDADRAGVIDEMDMRMRRHDRPGENQKIGRHRIEIADRAVGNDAGAAEPLMDMALHLAPKRAEADIGSVDIPRRPPWRGRRAAGCSRAAKR
jgi:hypothetical protein